MIKKAAGFAWIGVKGIIFLIAAAAVTIFIRGHLTKPRTAAKPVALAEPIPIKEATVSAREEPEPVPAPTVNPVPATATSAPAAPAAATPESTSAALSAIVAAGDPAPASELKKADASKEAAPAPKATKEYTLPELSEKFQKAVYKVDVYDNDGEKIGSGTAFAISADGDLITNYHVASSGEKLAVLVNEKPVFLKKIVAYNENDDLALLKLEGGTSNFVELAGEDFKEPVIGTRVAVIGGPLGLSGSLSEGIISSYRDLSEYKAPEKFIQITAPISPGSSGSPVFMMDGRVIGVATANLSGGQQLNFAVPVGRIKELLALRPQIKKLKDSKFQSADLLEGDDPMYKDLDFRRARLTWVRGNYSSAGAALEALLAKYPKDPTLLMYLGDTLSRQGEPARALEYLKIASKGLAKEPFVWITYGEALERGGYLPQAIQSLEYALTLDKGRSEVAARLGKLYAQQGNSPKAIASYQSALKGEGSLRAWAMELAKIYITQEAWDKAYAVLEPYLSAGFSLGESTSKDSDGVTDLMLLNTARRCLAQQGKSTTELDETIKRANSKIQKRVASQTRNVNSKSRWSAPSRLLGTWRNERLTLAFLPGGILELTSGVNKLSATWTMTGDYRGAIIVGDHAMGEFSVGSNDTLDVVMNSSGGQPVYFSLKRDGF